MMRVNHHASSHPQLYWAYSSNGRASSLQEEGSGFESPWVHKRTENESEFAGYDYRRRRVPVPIARHNFTSCNICWWQGGKSGPDTRRTPRPTVSRVGSAGVVLTEMGTRTMADGGVQYLNTITCPYSSVRPERSPCKRRVVGSNPTGGSWCRRDGTRYSFATGRHTPLPNSLAEQLGRTSSQASRTTTSLPARSTAGLLILIQAI
jgi:hypothetical protein